MVSLSSLIRIALRNMWVAMFVLRFRLYFSVAVTLHKGGKAVGMFLVQAYIFCSVYNFLGYLLFHVKLITKKHLY